MLPINHQRILGKLVFLIFSFVSKDEKGEVLIFPVNVVLSDNVEVQPDIVYISKEKIGIIGEMAITGIPDLVVEIISPGSYRRDRYEKFRIYEEFKVKEYWIVLPGEKVIEVWCLKEDNYVLHSIAAEKGEVESCILKGLKVKVEEVFK